MHDARSTVYPIGYKSGNPLTSPGNGYHVEPHKSSKLRDYRSIAVLSG